MPTACCHGSRGSSVLTHAKHLSVWRKLAGFGWVSSKGGSNFEDKTSRSVWISNLLLVYRLKHGHCLIVYGSRFKRTAETRMSGCPSKHVASYVMTCLVDPIDRFEVIA